MRSGGGEVGIARAPESAQVMVGGKSAIEGEERGSHVQSLGGEAIDEVCGCGKSISPIGGGHGRLEQQGASYIICGAKHVLGFTVLLRGILARHVERNPFGKKESTRRRVVKFTTIVTLNRFDGATKLSVHIGKKN